MNRSLSVSPYLLQPATFTQTLVAWNHRRRFALWRHSISRSNRLSSFHISLIAFALTLIAAVAPYQLTNDASMPLAATVAQASSVTVPSPQVTQLPGGPVGGLLPPGTMAPPYSYSNTYSRGQCTWYVAGRRQVPNSWGNAATWYRRAAAAGWSVGSVPAVGAIAWTSAGWYGHVALVEAVSGDRVEVSEMNYDAAYVIDTRWASAENFRYIY